MAGLYAPLPTLRRRPRGRLRTDRGRRGLLLLHRSGLSPHTPCQSPGALTRVAACTLARSPLRDPLSEGFRHFVGSMPSAGASGWSESPGGPRTHWKAPPCHGAPPLQTFAPLKRKVGTGKHGSRLDMAESELGVLSSQWSGPAYPGTTTPKPTGSS